MKFSVLLLVVLSVCFLVIYDPRVSFAQQEAGEGETNDLVVVEYEAVNPGNDFAYVFKRLQEKIVLAIFSFSDSRKLQYYEKLLAVRLAELKFVVDKKDIANIQTTSQRYSATAGELTQFLLQKENLHNRKDGVKQRLAQHLAVVDKLKGAYPDTTAEWRFVKHDEDYLKIYISQLSN